ncbi:MAG: YeeE/YedE family protein [Deltaproteobacteria bacterium]|nr:YeeE/YedE family protein [Deltaproteobacteria bacterium]
MAALLHLTLGLLFGFVLVNNGAADYDSMQRMFAFEEFRLFGTAIVTTSLTALGLAWLRRSRVAATVSFSRKPVRRGTVVGACVFGVGWGVSGTCPGTALVQLGSGHFIALATIAGIVVGQRLFDALNRRYWHIGDNAC